MGSRGQGQGRADSAERALLGASARARHARPASRAESSLFLAAAGRYGAHDISKGMGIWHLGTRHAHARGGGGTPLAA
jgi:hypothetical protein